MTIDYDVPSFFTAFGLQSFTLTYSRPLYVINNS